MNRRTGTIFLALLLTLTFLTLAGCSTSLPFFGVTVKVVDEKSQPVSGATVYSSGGDMLTTGADGTVSVRFSGMVGTYSIQVEAPGMIPNTLVVTLPLDLGKEKIAKLAKASAMGGAAPVGMSAAGMGMMGAGMSNMLLAQLYPMMFQYLFTANGYSLDFAPYQPGQWTEWKIFTSSDEDDAMVMRKAFLKRLDNKQEWWQVRLKGDNDRKDMLFEVLFSADRQSIRRMRNLGENGKPAEVPVSEGWYTPPQRLTQESLEGSLTKRSDSIKVPAGSFKADLYEFSNYGNGKVRMWRVASVPGALAKSQMTGPDDEESWHSELLKFGGDAKTELASY